MIRKIDHLNLKETAYSGQCFRWKEISDKKFSIVAYGKYLEIEDLGDNQFELSCDESDWDNIWATYFGIDDDYEAIEQKIMASGDVHLIEAFKKGSGIRILKQDVWEMVVSYLISQNNNISRIKNSIDLICKKAGFLVPGTIDQYRFPLPGELLPEFFDDKSLGLGYRDIYLKEIYSFALDNEDWIEKLCKLGYEEAKQELLKRKGIGPKVAECICLFGLHHVGAFPIDTHVKQLLAKYYPDGFDHEYYRGVAGIVQQYLFFYEIS